MKVQLLIITIISFAIVLNIGCGNDGNSPTGISPDIVENNNNQNGDENYLKEIPTTTASWELTNWVDTFPNMNNGDPKLCEAYKVTFWVKNNMQTLDSFNFQWKVSGPDGYDITSSVINKGNFKQTTIWRFTYSLPKIDNNNKSGTYSFYMYIWKTGANKGNPVAGKNIPFISCAGSNENEAPLLHMTSWTDTYPNKGNGNPRVCESYQWEATVKNAGGSMGKFKYQWEVIGPNFTATTTVVTKESFPSGVIKIFTGKATKMGLSGKYRFHLYIWKANEQRTDNPLFYDKQFSICYSDPGEETCAECLKNCKGLPGCCTGNGCICEDKCK